MIKVEKKVEEDPKGTVYGPNGEVVQTDVPHGVWLDVEDKSGTLKWIRNGSEGPKGAPID